MGLSAKERADAEMEEQQRIANEEKNEEERQRISQKQYIDKCCKKLTATFLDKLSNGEAIQDNTRVAVAIGWKTQYHPRVDNSYSKPYRALKILNEHLRDAWNSFQKSDATKRISDATKRISDAQSRGLMLVLIFGSSHDHLFLDMFALNVFSIMQGTSQIPYKWSSYDWKKRSYETWLCEDAPFRLGFQDRKTPKNTYILPPADRVLFHVWSPIIPADHLPKWNWFFHLYEQLPKGIQWSEQFNWERAYKHPSLTWVYGLRAIDRPEQKGPYRFYCPIIIGNPTTKT